MTTLRMLNMEVCLTIRTASSVLTALGANLAMLTNASAMADMAVIASGVCGLPTCLRQSNCDLSGCHWKDMIGIVRASMIDTIGRPSKSIVVARMRKSTARFRLVANDSGVTPSALRCVAKGRRCSREVA